MKYHHFLAVAVAGLLSACSAHNPGLFKTSEPLNLESMEIRNNLNLPFDQFIEKWMPMGAVNKTVNRYARVMSYVSVGGNVSGARVGERVESYQATDANGNDRKIIAKARDTFKAWCEHHSGQIGEASSGQSYFIHRVLVNQNNSLGGLSYSASSSSEACIKDNKTIATLGYTTGQTRGLSEKNYFPNVLLFAKDWSKS